MCLSNIEVIDQSMTETQLLPVSENKGGPEIQKLVTLRRPLTPFDLIYIFWLEPLVVYGLPKFEVSSFSHSGDIGGSKIEKAVMCNNKNCVLCPWLHG